MNMIQHIAEGRMSLEENEQKEKPNMIRKLDPASFKFGGRYFPCFRSLYSNTSYNERTVEIPIALHMYSKALASHGRVLEIGAVLPHYLPDWEAPVVPDKVQTVFPHLCLDLSDELPGVQNVNIHEWEFTAQIAFDLIISISTMDHVMDREFRSRSDDKKIRMFRNLISKLLSYLHPKGAMIITLPARQPLEIGGGSWIDKYLEECKEQFQSLGDRKLSSPNLILKMNRMGYGAAGNRWKEVDPLNSPDLPYYENIPSAGSVYFLFWGHHDRFIR